MGQQPVLYYTLVMGLGVTSIQELISTAYWYLMVSLEVHCTLVQQISARCNVTSGL